MKWQEFKERVALAIDILRGRDGNLTHHAIKELNALGKPDEKDDPMNKRMALDLINLIRVFSTQGHSGFSASYCRQMLALLLDFKPLSPITGDASEWVQVGEDMWQNNRCSHVFKDAEDGQAYDSQGVVFKEPSGSCYTGKGSRVFITFPYTPKIIYVDVPEDVTIEQQIMLRDQAVQKATQKPEEEKISGIND